MSSKDTAKLDRETEELHRMLKWLCRELCIFWNIDIVLCEITDERVSLDVGKIIQKGRVDKKMSQKDLATVGYETIDQGSNFIAAIVVEG